MRLTPCLNITPTGDDGRTSDGLIRGLNIKPLYLDVTIANPTSITYLNRGSAREEHVAIEDKEMLKNDKYSQRCHMIDSDFMPSKSMVLVLRNLKIS